MVAFIVSDESAASGDEAVHKSGSNTLGDSSYFVELKEDKENKCKPNPCKHDGACKANITFIDGYLCACKGDFGGINCESKYIIDKVGKK